MKIRREVSRRSVDDLFIYTGPVDGDEKQRLFESAHVFVLPSYSENFGIVNAEALAAGLPVITTTATPWREIEEEGCGWWIDPNADALTQALRVATEANPDDLRRMGVRGRHLIQSRYSWASAAEHFEHVYNDLVVSSSSR
jgi:glycosyltransferase involved in cell wall biosynthesis